MYARQRKNGYLQGKGERVTCGLHTCTHSRHLFNVRALHEQDEDPSPVSLVLRASQRMSTWRSGVSAIRVIARYMPDFPKQNLSKFCLFHLPNSVGHPAYCTRKMGGPLCRPARVA